MANPDLRPDSVWEDAFIAMLEAEGVAWPEPRIEVPLVTHRPALLPFCELDPRQFEVLVARMAKVVEGYREVRLYGVPGERQFGIDVAATNDGLCFTGYQCKRYRAFTADDLRSAVGEFVRKPPLQIQHLVVVVACSAESRHITDALLELRHQNSAFVLDLVDGAELSRRLLSHPKLVEEAFGAMVARAFCLSEGLATAAETASSQRIVHQSGTAQSGGTLFQIAGDYHNHGEVR
ncbi:hypothetical protein [Dactylosporangium sp. NPDC051484]|uniref:hypothetical protein n=1 Tax=Dactylosporangium sp. NPDC051484 TaxID=3154942 RepID=UPI00344E1EAA